MTSWHIERELIGIGYVTHAEGYESSEKAKAAARKLLSFSEVSVHVVSDDDPPIILAATLRPGERTKWVEI